MGWTFCWGGAREQAAVAAARKGWGWSPGELPSAWFGQPPGQLVAEQDVGELGLVVGPGAGVRPFALQVLEVDVAELVGVGGDGDHAARGAVLQPVEKQAGEQERREMVDGECALEAIR